MKASINTTFRIMASAALLLSAAVATAQSRAENFTIKTSSPEQTVMHFGASDAWSMKYIGLWPDSEQQKAADWLFSTENDASGKPKGIGLSVWRFNLGAGSEEQGDSSHINPSTRTECFLGPDGKWNFDKQAGQRRFLHLAKQRGVPYLLAFLNSAPVYYTQNGLATNTGRGGTINLKKDCYDDFARFISSSLKGLEKHDGLHIDYISPVNEPDGHWNWLGPKQEGSPATNREIAKLVRLLDKQMSKDKLTTKILVNESSDLRCLLGIHMTDWQRGNTLKTLFSKDSTKTYLGSLKHIEPVIAAHSYWTNTPLDFMKSIRQNLKRTVDSLGIDYWQTEICIMGNDEEIGGGGGYDFSMKTALYVARVIHHDLVYGNAGSWSWWRAVGGDYRDGLLRAYSDDGMKSGFLADSKLLWAMGNFSRFIRPEAVRYDMEGRDSEGNIVADGFNDVKGVMCSAYKNKDGRWVVVALNYSEGARKFNFKTDDGQQRRWRMYRTSDVSAESLAPIGATDGAATLAPRSITTFVAE